MKLGNSRIWQGSACCIFWVMHFGQLKAARRDGGSLKGYILLSRRSGARRREGLQAVRVLRRAATQAAGAAMLRCCLAVRANKLAGRLSPGCTRACQG